MNNQAKIDLCKRALDGTVNSMVQYIETATPYVPPACEERMGELIAMREEQGAIAHDLVELIAELDGVPEVGVFPYWDIDLNYLDVRFLCRFAAADQEKRITELEEFAAAAREDARVRKVMERLLEQNRRHLTTLSEIAAIPDAEVSDERRAKAQPTEAQHVPRPQR